MYRKHLRNTPQLTELINNRLVEISPVSTTAPISQSSEMAMKYDQIYWLHHGMLLVFNSMAIIFILLTDGAAGEQKITVKYRVWAWGKYEIVNKEHFTTVTEEFSYVQILRILWGNYIIMHACMWHV